MPSLKSAALCSLYAMIAAWLFNIPGLIVSYQAVNPYASPGMEFLASLSLLPLISSGLLIPLCIPLLFWVRWRKQVVLLILASVIYLAVSMCSMIFGRWIEEQGYLDFILKMKPLIQRIEDYRSSKGFFPETIKDCFSGDIPGTEMSRYPVLEYKVRKQGELFLFDSEWMLTVSDKANIRDVFFYLPSGKYPVNAYGGKVVRLKDWGRVMR